MNTIMQTIRILVVEDDYTTAMLLTDVLENTNYRVTIASDGEVAQHILIEAHNQGTPYVVVITDLMMEGVDGIGVLRTARQQEPPAEVIVLTGFGSLASAIDALRAGAYDYLLKPCKVAQLLSCVAGAAEQVHAYQQQVEAIQHLNQTAKAPSALTKSVSKDVFHTSHQPLSSFHDVEIRERVLHVGLLRLDRFRDVVFFDGTEIALTPTEYLLLSCLLESEGRVLSYQEIVRKTYGYEMANTESQALLKAHISHLRRKIDPSYLVNVRSVGYRLAASHTHALADGTLDSSSLKNTLSKSG